MECVEPGNPGTVLTVYITINSSCSSQCDSSLRDRSGRHWGQGGTFRDIREKMVNKEGQVVGDIRGEGGTLLGDQLLGDQISPCGPGNRNPRCRQPKVLTGGDIDITTDCPAGSRNGHCARQGTPPPTGRTRFSTDKTVITTRSGRKNTDKTTINSRYRI